MRCLNPVLIKAPFKDAPPNAMIEVRCNKCTACLAVNRAKWCYRLQKEQQFSKSFFVSLDYSPEYQLFYDYDYYEKILNDEYLSESEKKKLLSISNNDLFCRGKEILLCPVSDLDRYKNFVETVYVQEIQNFIKRVRKNCEVDLSRKLRYFAIGEYGGTFGRNHYHIAFFLSPDVSQEVFERALMKSWQFGQIRNDVLCDELISYITKYMNKTSTELPVNEHSLPCFSVNSNELGKRGFLKDYYYYRSLKHWKTNDIPFRTANGARISYPRTWKERYIDSKKMNYDEYIYFDDLQKQIKNEKIENFRRAYFPTRQLSDEVVISSYLSANNDATRLEIENSQQRFKHSATK